MGTHTDKRRLLVLALCGSLVALDAGDALAQEDDRPRRVQVNREGEYSGVKPGDGSAPGRRKRGRKNAISWIGFQARQDGGARLFVQLTSEVAYRQDVAGGKLVVHLEDARYGTPNARRRLDMRFFDTALSQVVSRRVGRRRAGKGRPARKAGVELTISFKNKSDAAPGKARLEQEKDGYHYLYLDFDPPSAAGISVSGSDDPS